LLPKVIVKEQLFGTMLCFGHNGINQKKPRAKEETRANDAPGLGAKNKRVDPLKSNFGGKVPVLGVRITTSSTADLPYHFQRDRKPLISNSLEGTQQAASR
jgi:hypothetical protein